MLEQDRAEELGSRLLELLRTGETDDGGVALDREFILVRGVRR